MAGRGKAAARAGGFLKKMLGDLIRPVRKRAGKSVDNVGDSSRRLFRNTRKKNPKPWTTRDPRFDYTKYGELQRTNKNIRAIIDKYDIKLHRRANPRADGNLRGTFGETLPGRMTRRRGTDMRIAPKAFTNEEELARTVYHENVHVDQIARNGDNMPSSKTQHDMWEDQADDMEADWWDNHPKNPDNTPEAS